jgi:dTDP-4-amino-4,6-dideoxygalactose transaminase
MNVPFVDLQRAQGPLRDELLAAFARVLDSGGYVQGAEVERFEHDFQAAFGRGHALAVMNGTAALHLALIACGVGPGDEVITVSNTFIATVEAISMTGATPVFADIAPDGFLVDPAEIERRITPRTKAVIAVHLYGELANMEAIGEIARRHNLKLIEDACQAHGATRGVGVAGFIGDVGCLSFYPTKNLGTIGEGGMVLTRSDAIAERVRSLRDHGQMGRHNHVEPGYNYRMPELQAAALSVMLPHLEGWNAQRRAAAARYGELLRGTGLLLPALPAGDEHVYHLYVVRTPRRDDLKDFLAERGIAAAIHYPTPIHLQPAYAGSAPGGLPHTERAVAEILSLPMHPSITETEIAAVADAVRAFEHSRIRETVGVA